MTIHAFKDKNAIIEAQECDGDDELFFRLVIKNEDDKFVFHLTPEQAAALREALS